MFLHHDLTKPKMYDARCTMHDVRLSESSGWRGNKRGDYLLRNIGGSRDEGSAVVRDKIPEERTKKFQEEKNQEWDTDTGFISDVFVRQFSPSHG